MEKKAAVSSRSIKVVPLHMDATFFFEKAIQSLNRCRYDRALKYFRKAVEYEPDNAVNHCNMAGILSEIGQFEESNEVLRTIIENVDPSMTECYFYMANNYANMDDFELAEKALLAYLEHDPDGQFLAEAEEMMELLSHELQRIVSPDNVKAREDHFTHDRARKLLEQGQFAEAVKLLEKLVRKQPEFTAAWNNLALAYFYLERIDACLDCIETVLGLEPGNVHALCNLAIYYQHERDLASLGRLLTCLEKVHPYAPDHVFKLAMTLGVLGRHEAACRQFQRLLRSGEAAGHPALYHYAAVAFFNSGRYTEAGLRWQRAGRDDPASEIPRFYLSVLKRVMQWERKPVLGYHYHLPHEERSPAGDPLYREGCLWSLKHGDRHQKMQMIEKLGKLWNAEVEREFRRFLREPDEEDELKRMIMFVLRSKGVTARLPVVLEGRETWMPTTPPAPRLPLWKPIWQSVLDSALCFMKNRYGVIEQHDLETLWVEFLTRIYPKAPQIRKQEGWAAALEYLTARMHSRSASCREIAARYGIAETTLRKNAALIDRTCGLSEKMKAIFPEFQGNIHN